MMWGFRYMQLKFPIRIDDLLCDILVESRYYMSILVQDTTHNTLPLDFPYGHSIGWCNAG